MVLTCCSVEVFDYYFFEVVVEIEVAKLSTMNYELTN